MREGGKRSCDDGGRREERESEGERESQRVVMMRPANVNVWRRRGRERCEKKREKEKENCVVVDE